MNESTAAATLTVNDVVGPYVNTYWSRMDASSTPPPPPSSRAVGELQELRLHLDGDLLEGSYQRAGSHDGTMRGSVAEVNGILFWDGVWYEGELNGPFQFTFFSTKDDGIAMAGTYLGGAGGDKNPGLWVGVHA